jgi:hypothetical protein
MKILLRDNNLPVLEHGTSVAMEREEIVKVWLSLQRLDMETSELSGHVPGSQPLFSHSWWGQGIQTWYH